MIVEVIGQVFLGTQPIVGNVDPPDRLGPIDIRPRVRAIAHAFDFAPQVPVETVVRRPRFEFGPVIFTIAMTTRQMLSLVISTIKFGLRMTVGPAIVGSLLVFSTVVYQISQNYFLARQPDTLIAT